jgi:hypothetical protein
MKKYFCTLMGIILTVNLFAQTCLRNLFLAPPEEAKPWTFWYWMYGAVSKEGITKDLEAMHEAGLGGFYLMPIKGVGDGPEYHGEDQQLSLSWWGKVDWSLKEADRLGLKMGFHFSDGFALAGGPWITPAESMQKIVWSDTIVNGGNLRANLPKPKAYQGYYQDIALFAIPLKVDEDDRKPQIYPAFPIKSTKPCSVIMQYDKPFICRNIKIVTDGNNYQANRFKVYVSDNGKDYRYVTRLQPARQGWQNTDTYATYAISPTMGRYFKFDWSPVGSEPGCEDMDAAKWKPVLKVSNIILGSQPLINQWEGKSGIVWRVALATTSQQLPENDCIQLSEIINLTGKMQNNKLIVNLPKGVWRILRMGHTSTGHMNVTGGGGKGLECDKFNVAAIDKQFKNWFGAIYNHTDSIVARRVITCLHVDSWECGSQNWSDNFAVEFEKRRGYSLYPWLPAYAGVPLESIAQSEKVLRDIRTTIAELISDVFFREVSSLGKKYGCELSSECVAPTMVSDGMLHYQWADRPMGEFWYKSPTHDKPNDVLDAVCGAHLYGKNIIQAEGFTELRGTWDEDPAVIKTLLDRNFALGINKLFFHVNVHNPYLDKKPGMTLDGIGLFFQRDQTWWPEAHVLVDYVARCQALLQYGIPVVDIAVFTGEVVPRRAILPERLITSLPGLFGEERVNSEEKRLKNEGQPQCVQPIGVIHSANMALPENWINPLRGYAYDSFNKDALLRLTTIKNGRIYLQGGSSYKVLVLPQARPMDPDHLPLSAEVEQKVEEMKKAGVSVLSNPWKGEDFSQLGLQRDVILPGDIAYMHRRGEDADIYFLSNQQEKRRTFIVSFRVSGYSPQLWDAVDGSIVAPKKWKEKGGRTEVEVTLQPNASLFVVFSKENTFLDKEGTVSSVKPLKVKKWNLFFTNTSKMVTRDTLFDWSKETDPAIKYYSGHVTYETHFQWDGKVDKVLLQMGCVKNIATVTINNVLCGTTWTYPYAIDITKALRAGNNRLKIDVVNTWANAIQGNDEGIPPFKGIWTNAKYRKSDKALLPAGLLGPLNFEMESNKYK